MDIKFLVTFVMLSIINVIFATSRSLVTVKGSKWVAAFMSGGYYAFYNVMIIYTVADFPIAIKCFITFCCNVVGVFLVKFIEEKAQKDKLWKVEATVTVAHEADVKEMLNKTTIPYNYIQGVGKYTIFNVFCATQEQSKAVKEILKAYHAKYFVSESKIL